MIKKALVIIFAGLLLAGCSSSNDDNRNEAVVPTTVRQSAAPSPTETTVEIGLPDNSSQSTPTPTQVLDSKPINLPVLFEFQARRFDMEFFFDNTQFLYYALIQVPTPCHQIDKVVSVSEEVPELVIIDIETYNTNNDCQQKLTTLQFSGIVDVTRNARFKVVVNKEQAVRLIPTPTPTPTPRPA